ncbi:MAG: tetratricopeptide repeat protein [Thainema sp.]
MLPEELIPQLLEFVQFELNMVVPNEVGGKALDTPTQVRWCLQQWKAKGQVLVILDDVTEQSNFQNLVQQLPKRFRVLITTRRRQLDAGFFELSLDVLSPAAAIDLLVELISDRRVQAEAKIAEELCGDLGHLPLGIELVGRYLAEKPFLKLAELRTNLRDQALNQRSDKYVMTAQQGVRSAFELSWQELTAPAQNVGRLLSLFAEDTIPWCLVERAAEQLDWNSQALNEAKHQLYQLHLIQTAEADGFKLHPLIHEFLRLKQCNATEANQIQQAFVDALIETAQSVPEGASLADIDRLSLEIAHLETIAKESLDSVADQDLEALFEGICRFYWNQGLYDDAQIWCEYGLQQSQLRLGQEHLSVATSLHNLAGLYESQGRYGEAEPLYLQALEMQKRLLGQEHPSVATSLNNLAGLYMSTLNPWKFIKAILLQIQSLKIASKHLGWRHPHTKWGVINLVIIVVLGIALGRLIIVFSIAFIQTLN